MSIFPIQSGNRCVFYFIEQEVKYADYTFVHVYRYIDIDINADITVLVAQQTDYIRLYLFYPISHTHTDITFFSTGKRFESAV